MEILGVINLGLGLLVTCYCVIQRIWKNTIYSAIMSCLPIFKGWKTMQVGL